MPGHAHRLLHASAQPLVALHPCLVARFRHKLRHAPPPSRQHQFHNPYAIFRQHDGYRQIAVDRHRAIVRHIHHRDKFQWSGSEKPLVTAVNLRLQHLVYVDAVIPHKLATRTRPEKSGTQLPFLQHLFFRITQHRGVLNTFFHSFFRKSTAPQN